MKNVYKSKFPKAPKAVKQDNKRLAAFILLGFFIFTAIGSILGIIAFARTSKEERAFNVVSANADVVDDIFAQQSLNLVVHDRVPISSNYHAFQSYYQDNIFNYVYSLYCKDISYFLGQDHAVIAPLEYFYPNYAEDNIFMAFTLDLPDSTLNDFPTFTIGIQYDTDFIEYFQFNRRLLGTQCLYTLDWDFTKDPHISAFLCANLDYYSFATWGSTVYFYNLQIKSLLPYYGGYAYTIEELRSQYEYEIEQAFRDGLSYTDGYQSGYDDGYSSAVDNLDKVMGGLLQYSNCTLIVNDSQGIRLFEVPHVVNTNKNAFMVSRLLSTNAEIRGYPINTLLYGFCYFDFTNFEVDVPLLDSYSFTLKFASDMEVSAESLGLRFIIYTDYTSYTSSVTKIDDYTFRYDIDLSSANSYEKITTINFGGNIAYLINTDAMIENQDARYNLGYESGYWHAYEQFRNEFQQQLNQEYQDGYVVGENNGYNKGYNEGAEAANNYTFTSLIGAVVDVPVKTFTSLFNFEILGVNLANFFYALFTCCVVLAIVKLLI